MKEREWRERERERERESFLLTPPQFQGKPYFTQDEVDAILTKMDNFWTLQESDAQAVIDQVNERFGFSAAKEKEEVKAEEEAPSSDDG